MSEKLSRDYLAIFLGRFLVGWWRDSLSNALISRAETAQMVKMPFTQKLSLKQGKVLKKVFGLQDKLSAHLSIQFHVVSLLLPAVVF